MQDNMIIMHFFFSMVGYFKIYKGD